MQHPATTAGLGLTIATTALTGLVTLSPAHAESAPVTTHERGIVMECTGSRHGLDAYVSLYENNLHGNTVQVILDDDPDLARSRSPRDVLDDGVVRTGVTIDGHRARIRGTAHRVHRRTPVHETYDDAGQHIVVDGYHRRLVDDLVLRWNGTRVPLTCDPAFGYRLSVTKTDITGG